MDHLIPIDLPKSRTNHVYLFTAVRRAQSRPKRNREGDRDKALETVLKIVDTTTDRTTVSPDVLCLAGRIYKDKFIGSNYEDKDSLDQAIQWYRKAFELSPLEYSGINLTTLLRASGQDFDHNSEMQQIAVVLNSLLGRKGALQKLTDYWDVATFFEVSVLAEDYPKACQAALKMCLLKPPIWFLKSTMENIKLINRCAATLSPVEKEKQQFLFWTEFFVESTEAEQEIACARFPVLIQELNKQYSPSYLTLNTSEGTAFLWHVLENSQQKKPPPGIHKWRFSADMIKAVSASKRDDRSMFLYVHENSDDFNLVFPSAAHCDKVMKLICEMTQELDGCVSKVLQDFEQEISIAFEYDFDNKGERIVLGRGTYGTVYSGRDTTTQRSIAIKEVDIKFQEEVQPLMEEIQLHSTLSHQNIVQYLGCEAVKNEKNDDIFRIFMEQVPGGSLSSLLRSKWGPLLDNEASMVYYARQILEGLKYLHTQKIVHRDIKGDNVLVNTYSGVCKISDFGTCKRLAGLNPVTETFTGTLQYMAPEVIDHGQRGYGPPADIWSFGCTMIEMATGKPPFVELGSPQAAMFKVGMFKTHPPIPEGLSEKAKKFILICFEPDPVSRPTSLKLLVDPFLQHARSGSGNKKHYEAVQKHARASHIGFSEIAELRDRPDLQLALEAMHASKTCDNRCMIESSRTSGLSPAGTINANLLSPPSSPMVDETNTHPGLTTQLSGGMSPAISNSAFSSTHTFNRTSSDESGMSSRFFLLKKDSERRNTLASFMMEYKAEIVDNWFDSLTKDPMLESFVTKEMLTTLLLGMRGYLLSKNTEPLQEALDNIRSELDYEPTAISQINLALYAFSDAVQPSLRQQSIKPHWIFALDNLIRSAVQAAVGILSPDLGAVLSVHEVTNNNVNRSSASRESGGTHSEHSTVESRPSSQHATANTRENMWGSLAPELRKEFKDLVDENRRLFEELVSVEKDYKDLLQMTLKDKRMRVQRLTEFMNDARQLPVSSISGGNNQMVYPRPPPSLRPMPLTNGISENGQSHSQQHPISPIHSQSNNEARLDGDLIFWLRGLGCDEETIQRVRAEDYSKNDLLECITRDELRCLGLRGGVTCRIWRAICQHRERSRLSGYLSPVGRASRQNSVDDFHPSVGDELYTVAEMT
uniref:mitogen-activated protein kinase kinase kinase n=1 Tax=Plectus sambesii TaxID=2011161 RepID=A0A914VAE1_9BILA